MAEQNCGCLTPNCPCANAGGDTNSVCDECAVGCYGAPEATVWSASGRRPFFADYVSALNPEASRFREPEVFASLADAEAHAARMNGGK